MLTNSSTLHICKKFDNSICNTVCAFLNTEGGRIFCYNNGKYYHLESDAKQQMDTIEDILIHFISDYPKQKIHYSVIHIDENYFIDIIVEKSTIFHYVINNTEQYIDNINDKKKSYMRSGKTNKPYNYELNFDIRPQIEYKEGYFKYGNFAKGNKFYKYMSLENALQSLRNGNIWFVEPSKWNDKYENYFYKATILGKDCSENNPVVYGTCVTNKKESESAWKIYAYNTQGLASRCVQFIMNRQRLRDVLINCKYRMDSTDSYNRKLTDDFEIIEGVVKYKDEQIIMNLPKSKIKRDNNDVDNEWYRAFFNNFTREKYMNLLLLKRNAFEHEQETRFFVVRKSFDSNCKKEEGHIDLEIPWNEIIEGVRFDSKCSDFEKQLLEEELKKVLGLNKTDSFPNSFIFKPYDVYSGPNPPIIQTS